MRPIQRHFYLEHLQKEGFLMLTRTFMLMVALIMLSNDSSFASTASFYYSDGPWMGKIIDAETKEPIEGAVVVAVWDKVYATPAGDNSYFFDAIETLTDREGKFFIKEFKAINILPILRRLDGPRFTVFKPRYTPFGHSSAGYHYFRKYFPNSPLRVDSPTLTEMFKKGIVIELFRLKTKEERIDVLPLSDYPFSGYDEKKKNYIRLLNLERRELGLDPYPEKGEIR